MKESSTLFVLVNGPESTMLAAAAEGLKVGVPVIFMNHGLAEGAGRPFGPVPVAPAAARARGGHGGHGERGRDSGGSLVPVQLNDDGERVFREWTQVAIDRRNREEDVEDDVVKALATEPNCRGCGLERIPFVSIPGKPALGCRGYRQGCRNLIEKAELRSIAAGFDTKYAVGPSPIDALARHVTHPMTGTSLNRVCVMTRHVAGCQ